MLFDLLRKARDDPWILLPYLEKYPSEACRGFFDAEGYVNIQSRQIRAANMDRRLIELFRLLLSRVGVNCTIYKIPFKDDTFVSPRNVRPTD